VKNIKKILTILFCLVALLMINSPLKAGKNNLSSKVSQLQGKLEGVAGNLTSLSASLKTVKNSLKGVAPREKGKGKKKPVKPATKPKKEEVVEKKPARPAKGQRQKGVKYQLEKNIEGILKKKKLIERLQGLFQLMETVSLKDPGKNKKEEVLVEAIKKVVNEVLKMISEGKKGLEIRGAFNLLSRCLNKLDVFSKK